MSHHDSRHRPIASVGSRAIAFLSLSLAGALPSFAGTADRVARGVPESGSRAGLLLGLGAWLRGLIRPETGPRGAALIIGAALAYGILHALGPGHQKTLIAGFALSGKGGSGEVARAAGIAAASHAASVIGLFGGIALLSGSLSLAAGDAAGIVIARASGLALIALAAAMLVKRCRAAILRHRGADEARETAGCSCAREHHRAERSSWAMVALGSLVPCPGAAFFMLYGFSAGNPLAGIAAVLSISAGMWITLFAVGMAATGARRLGERPRGDGAAATARWVRSALEIGGATLVLAFAVGLVL